MSSGDTQGIRFNVVGKTDVGQVREHNEDNFLVSNLDTKDRGDNGQVFEGDLGKRGLALVVADGMGGAAAGEVASQMAVDHLHDEFENADLGGSVQSEPDVIGLLETAIHKANEAIFQQAAENQDQKGMGTTLTGALVLGESLYLSQVGDSRGYVFRKGKLVQMTRDQSLIGQLIEDGTLTEEQAEKIGGKNIILQALGAEESLKIDSKRYDILRGDVLLLCSDGLTGMITDAEIETILNETPDLAVAAQKLIDGANAGGGKDNITVVLGRFEGEGLREPLGPAGEMDKAGGAWTAPPPPKSTASRNAIVATVVILAILAMFLFQDNRTIIVPSVSPGDATVKLIPADGDPQEQAYGGQPVTFGVGGGQFQVEVSAPGYETQTIDVDTTEFKENEVAAVELRRVPASSMKVLPPAYKGGRLSGVSVRLEPRGDDHHSSTKAVALEGLTAEGVTRDEFPAGEWTATATRPGFEPWESPVTVESGKPFELEVPALTEHKGRLTVKKGVSGATVRILDGEELLTDKPLTMDARLEVSAEVRAVRVTVVVEKPGFKFPEQRYEVGAGQSVDVDLGVVKAQVTFTGPEKGMVKYKPKGSAERAKPLAFQGGKTTPVSLAAGEYEVETTIDGTKKTILIKVQPGQILEKDVSKP